MEKNKYNVGMDGQKAAEKFLQTKSYQILTKNYRIKTGEIDLIAKNVQTENTIIFIEVKYRRGLSHGLPRESVNIVKQRKIIKTALHYIAAKNLVDYDFRFDVIEILEQNGTWYANHIENAFDASISF